MRNTKVSFALLSVLIFQPVWSADQVINPWQALSSSVMSRQAAVDNAERNVLVSEGRRLSADLALLSAEMSSGESIVISLPLPDGEQANYRFSRSQVMPDVLAEKYPQIQTFTAQDVDNATNTGSFDLTPQGFHGMFKHDGKWVFIDPEMRNDTGSYVSYYSTKAQALSTRVADKVLHFTSDQDDETVSKSAFSSRPVLGDTLRTYRLAVSASAEYTEFHGGTVSEGLAAINTLVNRLNEVYQRDLSVRFELVENNDEVIYTNSRLDPFNNSVADFEQNSAVLNGIIGRDNYDIGHVVNTGGGGLAVLGSICDDDNKAYGMTGTETPTGDAFYIDYVAHEIGHQLGANHTFNGTNLYCNGNRNADTAWEPGSGSTIMGYAGICGDQDLQSYSDGFFHSGSIEEMLETLDNVSCGTSMSQSNTIPTVDAGDDYTIPANTPFKLVGSADDANNDTLSYSWDEYDTGAAAQNLSAMVDNGNRPLFRSWDLSDTAERYFPRLEDVLVGDGYTTVGESYPTTDRDLTLRLTARDSNGGVATDETVITVENSAGPFKVTEPTSDSVWEAGDQAVVSWDVADTDQSPVNCSQVSISLSTDGGSSFGTTLVDNTANDGEYELTVGSLDSAQARVMVSCVDNVFFAVNQGEFSIGNLDDRGEDDAEVASSVVNVVDDGTIDTTESKSGGGIFDPFLMFLLLFSFRKKLESLMTGK